MQLCGWLHVSRTTKTDVSGVEEFSGTCKVPHLSFTYMFLHIPQMTNEAHFSVTFDFTGALVYFNQFFMKVLL